MNKTFELMVASIRPMHNRGNCILYNSGIFASIASTSFITTRISSTIVTTHFYQTVATSTKLLPLLPNCCYSHQTVATSTKLLLLLPNCCYFYQAVVTSTKLLLLQPNRCYFYQTVAILPSCCYCVLPNLLKLLPNC